MAVTLTADDLRSALGADAALAGRVASIHAACTARINRYAPGAPDAVATEALVLYAAWLYQRGAQRRNVFPTDQEGPPINVSPRVSVERCTRALGELARPAGGRECDLMRWPPWQSAPVEDRSSLTDQVITAILTAATGGGARPALATAALESCATLYASALSACAVSGPSSITRALTADWRASVASALIRTGQALYIIGANPPEGLVELRTRVCVDIGAACGVPKGLLDGSTSGQAARESWRQFVSTSVDGLARRFEAQLRAQLGVEVAIDTATLGGRDVQARAAAFRRLAGKEGGLTIDDARAAAGI